MTNVNISPFSLPPIDEHTMGHVLTEMADQERDDGKLDRAGWFEVLTGVGYPPQHARQILDRWFVKCSTCGEDATHLWAMVGEDGTIGSMVGNGKFAPSCDNCTGEPSTFETPQTGVLRAPLDFDPQRQGEFDVAFHDDPGAVADWLCNRQGDTLAAIITEMDAGYAREILALAITAFVRQFTEVPFDTVLLDLVGEARPQ